MNYKRMLSDLEQSKAEAEEKHEQEIKEIIERMATIRLSLGQVKSEQPSGDPIGDAHLRINKAAIITELNNELSRLADQKRELTQRHQLTLISFAKKENVLLAETG